MRDAQAQLDGPHLHVRDIETVQIRLQVQPWRTDRSGQLAKALRLAVQVNRTQGERSVRLPAQAELDRAIEAPLPLGVGVSLGAFESQSVEADHVAHKASGAGELRLGPQELVELGGACSKSFAAPLHREGPGRAGRRALRRRPTGFEQARRAGPDHRHIGRQDPALEGKAPADQILAALSFDLHALAEDRHGPDQHPPVGQPRKFDLSGWRWAAGRRDEAVAGGAETGGGSLDVELAIAPDQVPWPGHPRQAVTEKVEIHHLRLAGQAQIGQGPGKSPDNLPLAHHRLGHDLGETVDDKRDRQALGRLLGSVRRPARGQRQVVGLQADVHIVKRRSVRLGRQSNLRFRSEGPRPALRPARLLQHEVRVHAPTGRGPSALDRHGRLLAGPQDGAQAPGVLDPGQMGAEKERLIGRQTKAAGDPPPAGLATVDVELEGVSSSQVEIRPEKVPRPQRALHVQHAGGSPAPLLIEPSREIVNRAGLAESGLQLHARMHRVELDGYLLSLALRLGPQHRLAVHDDLAHDERLHVQSREQKLSGTPADARIVGLDPHPLGVAQRQSPHREAAQDITVHSPEPEFSEWTHLEAVDLGLDQKARFGGQRTKTQGHKCHARRQQRHHRRLDHPGQRRVGLHPLAPERRSVRPGGRRLGSLGRFRRIGRRVQKLCPMLR